MMELKTLFVLAVIATLAASTPSPFTPAASAQTSFSTATRILNARTTEPLMSLTTSMDNADGRLHAGVAAWARAYPIEYIPGKPWKEWRTVRAGWCKNRGTTPSCAGGDGPFKRNAPQTTMPTQFGEKRDTKEETCYISIIGNRFRK